MIQIPGFRTVLRGYDPTEVDRAIGDLIKARDQARSEAADNALARARAESERAQFEEQATAYRAQLAKAETATAEATAPSEIGARIGRMLTLAEDEANDLVAQARAEAERLVAAAKAEVEQLTGNAERHARDVVSKADTEAARILEAARRQSDEIVDYADREAVARREEAESIYEAHRARAAAAADEFERNVSERQQEADADFASRTQLHEQAITALLERQESLRAEAEQATSRAKAEADEIVRAAQAEALHHLEAARAEAAGVHAEAERALQLTEERRDAINAQLATVRQLLANLDAALPAHADNDPAAPDEESITEEPDADAAWPVGQRSIPEPSPEDERTNADVEPPVSETAAETDAEVENEEMAGSGQR